MDRGRTHYNFGADLNHRSDTQIIFHFHNWQCCHTVQYLLPLPGCVVVAHGLSIALSTGDVVELRASEALKERVLPPCFGRVHSVRRPVPQHEEEVREPARLAGGKTEPK